MTCTACLKPKLVDGYDVCFTCTKARHAAVMRRKCVCRKADKRPRKVDLGFRAFETCDRCLGTIRHLPDPPRRRRAA